MSDVGLTVARAMEGSQHLPVNDWVFFLSTINLELNVLVLV